MLVLQLAEKQLVLFLFQVNELSVFYPVGCQDLFFTTKTDIRNDR